MVNEMCRENKLERVIYYLCAVHAQALTHTLMHRDTLISISDKLQMQINKHKKSPQQQQQQQQHTYYVCATVNRVCTGALAGIWIAFRNG